MYQLVLIVCIASIFCFFIQEFIGLFKRIFSIKGVKIILPLAFASGLVYLNTPFIVWHLYFIQDVLDSALLNLMYFIPFHTAKELVALIMLLTLLAVLPSALLHLHSKKFHNKPYGHPYLVSTLIWVITVILLFSKTAQLNLL